MPIYTTPEVGIPLPIDMTPEERVNFREQASALCETVKTLVDAGADVQITEADRYNAHILLEEKDVPAERKPMPITQVQPGTFVYLEALLSKWDKQVVMENAQLCNYVTNRLLSESEDEDAKIRIKALELLGRIAGAFNDTVNINVTKRTIKDIEADIERTLIIYADESASAHTSEVDLLTAPSLDSLDYTEELGALNE